VNVKSAKEMAEKYILDNMQPQAPEGGYVVYEEPEEDQEGWYFSYQSKRYVETGDFDYSVVGNWPIFVDRQGTCPGPRIPPSFSSMEDATE